MIGGPLTRVNRRRISRLGRAERDTGAFRFTDAFHNTFHFTGFVSRGVCEMKEMHSPAADRESVAAGGTGVGGMCGLYRSCRRPG